MSRRRQFAGIFAACLAAGLMGAPVYGQKIKVAAQKEAAPERPARPKPPVRPKLPNSLPPAANPDKLPPRAIQRLQKLSPEQQEQFLRNNQRFNSLPSEQQAEIKRRLEAWNRLAPEQKQALRDRQRVWEQLSPEQKRYVQQSLFPRWQQMPPGRRQAILQRLHSLRDLSEAERQAKLNDPAFVVGLSPEDRDMLGQLAHLHVGMAPEAPGM